MCGNSAGLRSDVTRARREEKWLHEKLGIQKVFSNAEEVESACLRDAGDLLTGTKISGRLDNS